MSQSHPILALLIGTAILAGCSSEPAPQDQPPSGAAVAPRTYPAVLKPGTPLVMDIKVGGDPAAPVISGETNLPDGARLNANVAQGDRYMADGADLAVDQGRFTSPPMMLQGDPLPPGKYQIEIGSPLADIQPDGVRQIVGAAYENLTGPGLVEGRYGRTIEITRPHVVPGARDRQAEGERDKKRLAEVRAFYQRSCEETQTRHGLPTRTPKAKAIIAKCVRDFEAGLPN